MRRHTITRPSLPPSMIFFLIFFALTGEFGVSFDPAREDGGEEGHNFYAEGCGCYV